MTGALASLAAIAVLIVPAQALARPDCHACGSGSVADEEIPVSIEIFSNLVFSRLAVVGRKEASAAIDPQTGRKSVSGMVDLGGQAIQGRARITGMPHRAVRVILPGSVTMTGQGGGKAVLVDLVTDLPPWPVLDPAGMLEFSFGATLVIDGPAGGAMRGRIPIGVEYN